MSSPTPERKLHKELKRKEARKRKRLIELPFKIAHKREKKLKSAKFIFKKATRGFGRSSFYHL